MAKAEKKNAARILYMTGKYDQKDVAKMLGVNVATIGVWNKEEGWKESLDTERQQFASITTKITRAINYELMIMNAKISDAERLLKNGEIESASKMPSLDKGATDSLSKLFATIKKKELEYADKMEIVGEILKTIADKHPEHFDLISKLFDSYIEKIGHKK